MTPDETSRMIRRASGYALRQGVLYKTSLTTGKERIVPFKSERSELIKRAHDESGHFGARRTEDLLIPHYTWAGLRSDVEEHVKNCLSCQKTRISLDEPAKLSHVPVEPSIWHTVSFDCAGPFPESKLGNKYFKMAIDYFTKWMEVRAVKNLTSQTTSRFLETLIDRYGCMSEVITDQGSHFKGDFEDTLARNAIDHNYSRAYHPQADGLVERAIRTVKASLGKLLDEDSNKAIWWDLELPDITRGYNWSKQSSTGHSPFLLLHGYNPKLTKKQGKGGRKVSTLLRAGLESASRSTLTRLPIARPAEQLRTTVNTRRSLTDDQDEEHDGDQEDDYPAVGYEGTEHHLRARDVER